MEDVRSCLARTYFLQLFQYLQSVLKAVEGEENVCLLELADGDLRVNHFRAVEVVQGLRLLVLRVRRQPQINVQNRRPWVYLGSCVEVLLRFPELLLFVKNVSEPPVGVVVPLICLDRLLIALFGRLEIFVLNVLVAAESVSVRVLRVQLNCAVQEFESRLVLFL